MESMGVEVQCPGGAQMTPVMVVVLLVCLGLIVLGVDFDLIHMQWHGLLRTVIDSSVARGRLAFGVDGR